jgi:Holliday junction resolvase RusA-like endonuclease
LRRARFWVDGVPIPQGSISVLGGHAVAVTPRLAVWRADIKAAAMATEWGTLGPLNVPCGLSVQFYLPRPQKPRWPVPGVKPDGDKLLRAVQDALTATPERKRRGKRGGIIPATPGLVTDDSRFTVGMYRKAYGGPGALVLVWEIEL